MLTALTNSGNWKLKLPLGKVFFARTLIGADGRNSTVALRNLLPRPARERVALQAHIRRREIWKTHHPAISSRGLLRQVWVNETQLNLCLVGTPPTISDCANGQSTI
jgi:hypothetical protein